MSDSEGDEAVLFKPALDPALAKKATAVHISNADFEPEPEPEIPEATRKPIFDLLILSFGFHFLFLAWQGTQNLQTVLHDDSSDDGKIGSLSVGILYIISALTSALISTLVLTKITPKWSMALGGLGYVVYILANLHPEPYTLIPTAFIIGIGQTIVWAGQGTYLTLISAIGTPQQTDLGSMPLHVIPLGKRLKSLGTYNGIFNTILVASLITGNLISSLVLTNTTQNKLWWIYAGSALLGVLFITRLTQYKSSASSQTAKELALHTISMVKDKRMQLIIPLLFYTGLFLLNSGIERAFFSADFTANYIQVNSDLGDRMVGYVLTVYGATNMVGSLGSGWILDQQFFMNGHIFISGFAALLHLICFIVLLAEPNSLAVSGIWAVSALYGLADGITLVVPNYLLAKFWPEDLASAFGSFRFW